MGADRPPLTGLGCLRIRRFGVRTNAAETDVLVSPTCTTQRILPVRHGQPCDKQHETTRSQYALDQPERAGRAGGQGRDRTADLPLFRRTLIPTELPGREGIDSCPGIDGDPDGTRTRDLRRDRAAR